MDSALELQGMPWMIRKAVSFATIKGRLSQKTDELGVTVIQVAQTATGGIKGETETYRLDGSETTQGSGHVRRAKIQTRWLDLGIGKNGGESSLPTNLAGRPTDQ
jgi:hypothetical protein